ncbi:uncharacterized protein LOC127716500 [Mytilus californianus]|uniref:uncharacterized protein LOC127716500 n=1 Tax=Mytilus californianus TaxID=6549 RepID=UPI002247320F|nr:uncharacterized protein LOC127716500 [Mytilus californianus]
MELLAVLSLTCFIKFTESIHKDNCIFHKSWWINQWVTNDGKTENSLYITNSTIANFRIPSITSETFHCYSKTQNIYLLRSTRSDGLPEYVCMMANEVRRDLYCLYLIKENSTTASGNIPACSICTSSSSPRMYTLKHFGNQTIEDPITCSNYKQHCHKPSEESSPVETESTYGGKGSKSAGKNSQTYIVGIVIGIFVIGGFLIGLCVYIAQQRQAKEVPEEVELNKIDSDEGTGPVEDFKDITVGEIQLDRVDL